MVGCAEIFPAQWIMLLAMGKSFGTFSNIISAVGGDSNLNTIRAKDDEVVRNQLKGRFYFNPILYVNTFYL